MLDAVVADILSGAANSRQIYLIVVDHEQQAIDLATVRVEHRLSQIDSEIMRFRYKNTVGRIWSKMVNSRSVRIVPLEGIGPVTDS